MLVVDLEIVDGRLTAAGVMTTEILGQHLPKGRVVAPVERVLHPTDEADVALDVFHAAQDWHCGQKYAFRPDTFTAWIGVRHRRHGRPARP